MPESYDVVVVGAGPNGLAAAIEVARAGLSVLVLEAAATPGGGARTEALTLPGYRHDVCSAVHPLAAISPFFRSLDLASRGVQLLQPPVAVAHPLDDGEAGALRPSLQATAAELGEDGAAWSALFEPFLPQALELFDELLRPIRIPRDPLLMARFGWLALQSASSCARAHFTQAPARALFAGCAAHSFLALDQAASASFGLVLGLAGHAVGWPIPRSGSSALVDAMLACLRELGGVVRVGERVTDLAALPTHRAVIFDVMPRALAELAGDQLPASYADALRAYRYGPGVFKVDWALDAPIPWTAAACREAGTVHLGGTLEEIEASESAAAQGRLSERPYVLLAQPSLFDDTRAPAGKHTAWAYCHVPSGCNVDRTEVIEQQIERFAPGFRDTILARSTRDSATLEADNANYIGGDIGGGANDLWQVLARPVLRWDPYTTPNPRLFLASAATPPGGGVHGMGGVGAARAVVRRLGRTPRP